MYSARYLDIPPLVRIGGTVRVPGSKSISNRALLLAGFAEGTTRLDGLLHSDDTAVMIDALRALGAAVETAGETTTVAGVGRRPAVRAGRFFLGNAGTAMRPLAAALAIVAAGNGGRYELAGTPRMHERPIGDLVDALRALGADVEYLEREGFPPLAVSGPAPLRLTAPIRVRGDVSSQFLSSLLMALPLRLGEAAAPAGIAPSGGGGATRPAASDAAPGDVAPSRSGRAIPPATSGRGDAAMPAGATTAAASRAAARAGDVVVAIEGELISRPYVDLTLAVLERFGVHVVRDGDTFRLPAGAAPRSPGQYLVEGDASSASYFVAAGAIAAAGGPLRIEGVGRGSIQGDLAFADAVRSMGAAVEVGEAAITVARGRFPLAAIDLDCTAMPDAAMTLAALALYADAPSRLTGIASWRVKETDRVAAMATELRKVGARVEVRGDDELVVHPPEHRRAATVATYDDHRMAMAMSLAAFVPPGGADAAARPIRIVDPRCVAKTWPDYFEALFAVAEARPQDVPVLTVDGPTASGKGTLAAALAAALGFHQLDSGALYRSAALAALDAGIDGGDVAAVAGLSARLDLRFSGGRVHLAGRDVTDALRLEHVGALASRISAHAPVREALLAAQLAFRRVPGLVADGRDMGTVVFPDAALKVFLTAGAAERAERRFRQLLDKGIPANIDGLFAELEARDARDQNRSVSPLKPAEGALLLDNSALSIEASVDAVLNAWHKRRPFDRPAV